MSDGNAQRQALADKIRQNHQRKARRRRSVATVLIVLIVVVALALLGWRQLRASEEDTGIAVPENATDDYGFTLTPELAGSEAVGTTPVDVQIFEDFLCPSCKAFHDESGPFLAEQVANGTVSITYHPFTFLLEASTDEYAQRAANAAVCVADDAGVAAYAAMHDLLLQNQPAEGGAGLSDDQLIAFATQAGAGDVTDCVADRTFTPWVERALEEGRAADVTTTPTVRIGGMNVVRSDNGTESIPGPEELQFAIEAAQ
ncbi:thioredoxin domain-containing protein [Aeromicrobium sp. YIM 150415]|uniref:DsbA family protein n=1 Tax=Aeromicrobium sp. YIM 150415 TaxID=2803912 RepID=UPI001964015C|nr:thioredoxin domain-containing protein [Aeromicrobium sp. YIM 150415]MBM9462531.1 thioredoxin domain-containing protein [Aeromicrobium sp. YIM 150415]